MTTEYKNIEFAKAELHAIRVLVFRLEDDIRLAGFDADRENRLFEAVSKIDSLIDDIQADFEKGD